jgi:hypothetical protein
MTEAGPECPLDQPRSHQRRGGVCALLIRDSIAVLIKYFHTRPAYRGNLWKRHR